MSSKALNRIGVDLAQFFPNQDGYTYIIVIVDHLDKHVYLEATMEKTALSLARTLFRYFALFGVPDELRSDPGSDLTSIAVKILLETFRVHHTFSLVDIHTGNGAEPSSREVLRHLKNRIYDSTSRQYWHQPEFLQAVASIMNNHISSITYIQQLDAMLTTLAECSTRYQLSLISRNIYLYS